MLLVSTVTIGIHTTLVVDTHVRVDSAQKFGLPVGHPGRQSSMVSILFH